MSVEFWRGRVLLLDHLQVAILLGMLPRRVITLARRGQIPSRLMPDGEPRFVLSEIEEWIKSLPDRRQRDEYENGSGI